MAREARHIIIQKSEQKTDRHPGQPDGVDAKAAMAQSALIVTLFNLEGTRPGGGRGPEIRGFSSAGRAPALQAGGQRFDPANLHQKSNANDGPVAQLARAYD